MYNVGDLVVCVRGSSPEEAVYEKAYGLSPPVLGVVYRVRAMDKHCCEVDVLVEELINPVAKLSMCTKCGKLHATPMEPSFTVDTFKPVSKTSTELFEKLSGPTPQVKKVLEDA